MCGFDNADLTRYYSENMGIECICHFEASFFDIFVYVDVYLDIWDYNMKFNLLEMGCVAFKFASVWDCKICISKWINVKGFRNRNKNFKLSPKFYVYMVKIRDLLIVKTQSIKYNYSKDECINSG